VVEYRISENEYARANRLFVRPGPRQRWLYGLIATVLLALAAVSPSWRILAGGALVGGVAGYLLTCHVILPWLARRQYRNYPAVRTPAGIALDDDGLRFRGRDFDSLLRWGQLIRWRENDEFILVYQTPRLYHIVPKRLARDGLDIDALRGALGENIGPAR